MNRAPLAASAIVIATLIPAACNNSNTTIAVDADSTATSRTSIDAINPPEATSLLGDRLYPPPLPVEVRMQREADLYKAQLEYDANLHDEQAIIWLGRRLAYLGRYREAIDVFSNGLAIMPESFRLLRHRGHRYITVREFDSAIADLSRAAALVRDLPDEIEPDGQPNASGIPTSTTNTNIFYHLGLAHYLRGEWPAAATAYQACFDAATNDDMRVAAAYWLYLSHMRTRDDDAAAQVLDLITADMNVVENESYWKLLLLFKGEVDEGALQATDGVSGDRTIDLATIGYGLGVRDLIRREHAAARERFQTVISQTNWAAFGHIAAEAELARMSNASH